MRTKEKQNRAITLIALVITIIILLILAGISIVTLSNTGLFEKTNKAKTEYEKSEIQEELQLAVLAIQSGNINKDNIKTIIKELPEQKNLDLSKLEWDKNQENEEPNGAYKGYNFYINKNCEVIIGEKTNAEEDEFTYIDFKMPKLTANDCIIEGENYKVTASSEMDSTNQPAYTVFDRITTDNKTTGSWHAEAGVPQWIEIELPYKVQINTFTIKNRYVESAFESYTVKDFELLGSEDGENWTSLGIYENQQGALKETTFNVKNSDGYRYYRLNCTSSYNTYITIGEIILNDAKIKKKKVSAIVKNIDQIGEVTISSYSKIKSIVEYYNLLDNEEKNTVTNFNKLQEAINKYNELNKEEKFEMPVLTANNCSINSKNYKVTASSSLSSYEPYKIFDGVVSENSPYEGCWHSNGSAPQWVQVQFPFKVKIKSFTIKNRYAQNNIEWEGYNVKDFELQASNDGKNWITLGNYTNQRGGLLETKFNVQNPEKYYFYRWYATTSFSSYVSIGEIILNEAYVLNNPNITLNK